MEAELTFGPHWRFLRGVDGDDLRQHIGKRNPDAAFPVFLQRGGHNGRDRFREAVAFQEFHLSTLPFYQGLEVLLDRSGQGVGTAEGRLETAQISVLKHRITT